MPDFLIQVRGFVGHVPFVRDAVAMFYCATDSNTPTHVKVYILGALGYFLNPFDAIPDVIAGMGFVDDATAIGSTLAVVGSAVTKEHWQKADRFLSSKSYT